MRRAARVVLVDPAPSVLLLSGRDPSLAGARGFWFVPGGGAEDEETLEEAARREVFEEVGARLGELGPVAWRRQTSFMFDGQWFHQDESFFVVPTERFTPRATALTDLEVRMTTGARWWPVAELSETDEVVYPIALAHLVALWLQEGVPPQPLVIE